MIAISEAYEQRFGDIAKATYYCERAVKLGGACVPIETVLEIEDKSFVREKYALIVGVGNFAEKKEYIPPLDYAAKDARDFANVLIDPNVGRFRQENVQLLTDEDATVLAIKLAINDIARKARPEDLVVLYFSSHGSSADMDTAMERGQTGYIVTHDTRRDALYATAFAMKDLQAAVYERFKAERVVVFLDTCYSGNTVLQATKGSKAMITTIPVESIARVAQGKGRAVIASSRNDELSWESASLKNSYFTYYLMESMRDGGGVKTITQLYTDLQRKVSTAVKEKEGASQTPIMYPEGHKLDIVIGTIIQ
jgi:uncharacterized caspase-like protein